MNIGVSFENGNVVIRGEVPGTLRPEHARLLARMLLVASEGAQDYLDFKENMLSLVPRERKSGRTK